MPKALSVTAALFLLSTLFYNNCSGNKGLVGAGVALNSGTTKSNSSSSTSSTGMYQPGAAMEPSFLTSSPEIRGVFDGVRDDLVMGWACIVNKSQATTITIKADGIQVAEFSNGVENEPAVSDSSHCNSNYTKHRFMFRFREDQMNALANKAITVFASDPLNSRLIAQLSPANPVITLGMRPIWYSRLPAGAAGAPISNPASPTLVGYWDSSVMNSDGSMTVAGWACVRGSYGTVALSILTTQNEMLKTFEANSGVGPSEADTINSACQSSGTLRRFGARIDAAVARQYVKKEIRIVLTEPFVSGVYYQALQRVAGVLGYIDDPPVTTTGTRGGTGTSGTGGTPSSNGTPNTCSPTKYTESCWAHEICPNGTEVNNMGFMQIEINYNFSATVGQTIPATPTNSSATNGFKLTDMTGFSFFCNAQPTSPTVPAGSTIWVRTVVPGYSQCNITRELPATDPRCCVHGPMQGCNGYPLGTN